MTTPELFDGQPVIEFKKEPDRRNFIRMAALVGFGGSLAAAGFSERLALARTDGDAGSTDVAILNYALTLEYLEAEFYDRGIDAGILEGRTLELVTPIRTHEFAHVEIITTTIQALGGTPVDKPNFVFEASVFAAEATFLKTASVFEETGVTAYHGQVARIESLEVLAGAAAIAGVESRHAAVIADLIDAKPFPAPFEARASMEEVLAAVKPFIA